MEGCHMTWGILYLLYLYNCVLSFILNIRSIINSVLRYNYPYLPRFFSDGQLYLRPELLGSCFKGDRGILQNVKGKFLVVASLRFEMFISLFCILCTWTIRRFCGLMHILFMRLSLYINSCSNYVAATINFYQSC